MLTFLKFLFFTNFLQTQCGKIPAKDHLPYDNLYRLNDSISEKTITLRINGINIEGTLLSSKTVTADQKLVIIIAGSGPTDRNGNSTVGGVSPDSYKLLAQDLANEGIAVFRYDKRGVGKSRPADFQRKNLRFDDYINDAIKIFEFMRDTLGFKEIWFAGHSEGSDIAIVASQQKPVKGLISLCGGAGGTGETILRQIKEQMPSMSDQASAIIDSLKHGTIVYKVPQKLAQLFAVDVQSYWMSWIRYIPSQEITMITVPVLILQGTCDEQVTVADAMKLKEARPESKLVIIEKMTHTLKNARANCKGDDTYTNPLLPLNPQLVKEITTFIGH